MKIVFVYNANSNFINLLMDIGHRVVSPETYRCNLCMLTYSLKGEKKVWKDYRALATDELEFLHKDEFEKKYNTQRDYPVVLELSQSNQFQELVSKEDLEKMNSVTELIEKLKK